MHPFILDQALTRAERHYRLGDFEAAQSSISPYLDDLDEFFNASVEVVVSRNSCADCIIDETRTSDLLLARSSMSALVSRIENNLDYYGNQGGWAPMLSFEVLRTVVAQEVDGAIETMYFVYWLQKASSSIEERNTSLTGLVTRLRAENDLIEEDINKNIDAAPALKYEMVALSTKTAQLQWDLQQLEEKLIQQATEEVAERNKTPWWKKGLKIGSSLLKAIPVYQPGLRAVGGSLATLAAIDYSSPDPLGIALESIDIYAGYADAKASEAGEAPSNSNGTSFSTRAAFAGAVTSVTRDIAATLKSSKVPRSEVESALDALVAESKEFQGLAKDIRGLVDGRGKLATMLDSTLQGISDSSRTLQQNLVTIDTANRELLDLKTVNSGRLDTYLNRAKKTAVERLLKYKYYFAKASEYRLLQPFQYEDSYVDVDELITLHEASQTSPMDIGPDQFVTLKTIYLQSLRRIAESIFDEMVLYGNSETSTSKSLLLSPQELNTLNEGSSVVLSPMSRGLFRLDESNIRITCLEVDDAEFEGIDAASGDIEFTAEHSGTSTFRDEAGGVYAFHHSPLSWGSKYHLPDGPITQVTRSAASDSLLMSLLEVNSDNIMLFSRPAAWSDVSFRMTRTAAVAAATVKRLKLKMCYDRTLVQSLNIVSVRAETVDSNHTDLPYFILSEQDVNGRADGRGSFYRAYPKLPSQLNISTQTRFGDRLYFDHWQVVSLNGSENRTVFGPYLSIEPLDIHTEITAFFREQDPTIEVPVTNSMQVEVPAPSSIEVEEWMGEQEMESSVAQRTWMSSLLFGLLIAAFAF
ncbi:expressed unknown protein [Seminavis robusta]|uniref:Uncharacterized protein n=1 Tax=Seminavis robusta TaxID=568900 RepID=A0A9N8ENQ3_9STRA|nr:expressed unknown protein [Seminavis robusta]|eukprot:Sro1297_g260480.1 n/a (810) ;mRNA; r:14739-17242